ncbi:MAG: hypothetical protein IKF78_07800 [Atopobiaceae bacterium]|nr:hypothetical protein [Atopobiaceae bacterium]
MYGAQTVNGLARDLTLRYGRGHTRRALYKYLQFYRAYSENERTTIAPVCALGGATS